ncbi:hypothetical protein DsansV1_C10g0104021 [Dioscorea sansibarensis]
MKEIIIEQEQDSEATFSRSTGSDRGRAGGGGPLDWRGGIGRACRFCGSATPAIFFPSYSHICAIIKKKAHSDLKEKVHDITKSKDCNITKRIEAIIYH